MSIQEEFDVNYLDTLDQKILRQIELNSNYKYQVALGNVSGATTWNKFGYNADVDVGTEVVASFGGTFAPLLSASTLSIVSTSTSDTLAGTGSTRVILYGVNADRESTIEVVEMNGTTPVVTTSTWLGINRVSNYLAGTNQVNVGTITVTATSDSSVQAEIPAGEGSTQQLIFFSDTGKTCLMDWLTLNADKTSGGGNPRVTFKIWVYSAVSQSKYLVARFIIDTQTVTNLEYRPTQPFILGEKSVIWVEATTDTANTEVTGRFSLIEQ